MASDIPVSPFAPHEDRSAFKPVTGARFASIEAGIKYRGRKDLMLAAFDEGTVAAGVTTQSKTCSAPVLWCRDQLAHGRARGLVVNAGNANAFTGVKGAEAARITAEAAAEALGCSASEVYLASTGVIGEPLEATRFTGLLDGLAGAASADGMFDAASTIMTTDTFAKRVSTTVAIDGVPVTLSGIAKGSGMIAPDMATMLSFIFTDARIAQQLLQSAIERACSSSFNCVTVDSDTSTSDTLLAFATQAADMATIDDRADPRFAQFQDALCTVCEDLAVLVAKDGEGISKFITVKVAGAEDDHAAKTVALSIANSPLVKTAVAGEDANWGRVVMAVGKAGEAADRDRLAIRFGPHTVATDGERAPGYSEEAVSAYMTSDEIEISVDLGIGDGAARVWTCDLTHGYISINADYRS
ncbi:MAG: bifunctional glutamate N-acetyltransferase/amino-acid acetyltransferase ArgJ [Pseudomonadota bacterium]